MRARDQQRQKLYNAEKAAIEHPLNPHFSDIKAIKRYTKVILRLKWLQHLHFKTVGCPLQSVLILDGRRRRSACARGNYRCALSLPRRARNMVVYLHELAHTFVPHDAPDHGDIFAGVYLVLVQKLMLPDVYNTLLASFKQAKLSFKTYG